MQKDRAVGTNCENEIGVGPLVLTQGGAVDY
jgi:hypothetical protein